MITNISLVTVYCLDQDKARRFLRRCAGLSSRTPTFTMGEDSAADGGIIRASRNWRSR